MIETDFKRITKLSETEIVSLQNFDCGVVSLNSYLIEDAKEDALEGVPSAYEEFVSIRNRFKNFAVILYI